MRLTAADLFCGAGGTSSGLVSACHRLGHELDLVAVNHWDRAIETHSSNHRAARHLCANLDSVDPRELVPSGRLNVLVASPECTHHSTARGGRPMSDQSRSSASHVLRWAELLRVDHILVENVPEFRTWGPLGADGRPMKSKKGQTYRAWCAALASMGYRVEDRILNAADYGDATTRQRLFVQARRGNRRPSWPIATHSRKGGPTRTGATAPWRPAREVIDWDLKGTPLSERTRPLAASTLRRIQAGIARFGPGVAFVLGQQSGSVPRPVSEPLPTVSTGGAISLSEPFLVDGQDYQIDVRFRMLEPRELAGAMGFDENYAFAGTRRDQVKLIGNAVPVGTADALCSSVLSAYGQAAAQAA